MSIDSIGNSDAAQGADSAPAANQASNPSSSNASTKFNSMAELREKEPELFRKIVEGLGMAMCSRMRRNQERNTRLRKEYQRNA
ncbi:MAG: hypothetical protein H0W50_04350 [Parachlamydiaceae bacterium]|nr:hypothetical protein [Parachlamydiaceae bacterium]